MSTVKLTAFSLFKSDGNIVTPLIGAVDGRINKGTVELLAGSVPFHSDDFQHLAPKAGCGLLQLYGVRDVLEDMQFWRTKARETGAEFASAEIEYEIGTIEVGLADRKVLRDSAGTIRFLNLRRMRASLQSEVLYQLSKYAASEGRNTDEEMSRVSQIASRPDLFDQLLLEDVDLAKLDILVIPVADDASDKAKLRQLGYVRPGAKPVSIVQSNDAASIVLPAWMSDLKLAAEYRNLALAA